MTFSIVAGQGTAYGVAVASKFLAVGAVVPAATPGVGAVATQSFAKVSYKADSLALLRAGAEAPDALARLTAADSLRETRQVGIVGAHSQSTFTGAECLPWAGGVCGGDDTGGRYAIQGNVLTGPEVVAAMEDAWTANPGMPLARRLLAALLAGDDAGGDRRGRQGAALYVVDVGAGYDECGVVVDLRVDDSPTAAHDLARLLDLNDLYFGGPEDLSPLEGALADEVRGRLASLGYRHTEVDEALAEWAGVENYEMRLLSGQIDGKVLAALRAATGG
ncbi:MAG TPA: DUF1028 domain-containing protein [Dermatophilaceae bacterium]|jgi:uncharacterized Ntn-hydrolase superfamily protein|nr:DUF1028 domain-containing protein [Actinomycetales bacterium]HMT33244.1 DUF1028 domain-containing protein [Dermatophilaceae bacterium]HMT88650.1 DUF1028 domain-containing protein [Dermatophilaceae bacterium]